MSWAIVDFEMLPFFFFLVQIIGIRISNCFDFLTVMLREISDLLYDQKLSLGSRRFYISPAFLMVKLRSVFFMLL